MVDVVGGGTVMSLQETVAAQLGLLLRPSVLPSPVSTLTKPAAMQGDASLRGSPWPPSKAPRQSPANDYTNDPFLVQPLDETAAPAGTLGETQGGELG